MISYEEAKHFMEREKFKLQKWKRIKEHYEKLAAQAEEYKQELNADKKEMHPLKTIFLLNCISTFKMISEKADKKIEKWTERSEKKNNG